jgi:hypothetical protein
LCKDVTHEKPSARLFIKIKHQATNILYDFSLQPENSLTYQTEMCWSSKGKGTGLEWLLGFQQVKASGSSRISAL